MIGDRCGMEGDGKLSGRLRGWIIAASGQGGVK
jgi:hypothetical protein